MANIDLSGLKRFQKRLEALKNINSIAEKLVQRAATRGAEILENKYDLINTGNEMPDVTTEITGKSAKIIASGKDVMFEEFGTGTVGRDSVYPGNLPTETIRFTSGGIQKSTNGWEYYYLPSSAKHTSLSGRKVWKVPKGVTGDEINEWGYTSGQKSQHQIFDTARELEKEIPQIFSKILDEELNNV